MLMLPVSGVSRASIVSLLAALVALAVYLATLSPGLPAGDSGELITVAATLGVAHPPGYPLYAMLGHLWLALLPWGSVAWRMNLLSALFAAATVAVLTRLVLRLTRSAPAALVAGGLLAFSTPFWKLAIVAEVFSLNALFAALLLDALVDVLHRAGLIAGAPPPPATRLPWSAFTLAFLSGLLVTHHHTLVLLALPLDATVLALQFAPERRLRKLAPGFRRPWKPGEVGRWRVLAILVLGLAPLVYIPLAASHAPPLSWGDVHGVRDFLRLLLRVDYGSLRLESASSGYAADRSHALLYLASLGESFGLVGVALLLVGVVALRRWRVLAVALAGFALLQWLFFTRVGFPSQPLVLRGVVERFYVLPNVVLAAVAGLGAAVLLTGFARFSARARLGVAVALVALAWGIPLATHWTKVSQRGNRFAGHLAEDVLACVPEHGVLFEQGDLFHNTLAYLMNVERQRPDVTVVDEELMTFDWYVRSLRRHDPGLLPRLGGGERIQLMDGTVLEGPVLEDRGDTLGVLTTSSYRRFLRRDIARRDLAPDPSTLYPRARQDQHSIPFASPSEDRYSGLPGSVNVRWIDHLFGRRPVTFLGLKEDSWALRYNLIPHGYVLLARPRGEATLMRQHVSDALDRLATAHFDDALAHYDPSSFEAGEVRRVLGEATHSTLLLCQPEAQAPEFAHHPGLDRLAVFLTHFEAMDPTPDMALLRAAGLLHVFHPRFQNGAQAALLLGRYLASGATGTEAEQARVLLAGLPRH
jgi:Protein of unknown function (DUF2723)